MCHFVVIVISIISVVSDIIIIRKNNFDALLYLLLSFVNVFLH